jgi:hypothetical protein
MKLNTILFNPLHVFMIVALSFLILHMAVLGLREAIAIAQFSAELRFDSRSDSQAPTPNFCTWHTPACSLIAEHHSVK